VQPLGVGSVDDAGAVEPSETVGHPVGIAPRAATVDTRFRCSSFEASKLTPDQQP
jgi:hypothetical protein